MFMFSCLACHDTGYNDTGNNVLPCDCPAGNTALFTVAMVKGAVTGAEMRRFFFNRSSEKIPQWKGYINAEDLPSRKKSA